MSQEKICPTCGTEYPANERFCPRDGTALRSQGGGTDLGNLVLVCSRHHTLIHRDGFRLVLRADRRLSVSTAAGVPVLHHPARPWADPAGRDAHASEDVSAETLTPTSLTARMDLDYCVMVLKDSTTH